MKLCHRWSVVLIQNTGVMFLSKQSVCVSSQSIVLAKGKWHMKRASWIQLIRANCLCVYQWSQASQLACRGRGSLWFWWRESQCLCSSSERLTSGQGSNGSIFYATERKGRCEPPWRRKSTRNLSLRITEKMAREKHGGARQVFLAEGPDREETDQTVKQLKRQVAGMCSQINISGAGQMNLATE